MSQQDPTESSPLLRPETARSRTVSANFTTPVGVSPIIHENDDAITIRRPVQFHSLNRNYSAPNLTNLSEEERRNRAQISRLKYYSRLTQNGDNSLMLPNHLVPSEYFLVIPISAEPGSQSSLVTIFSIWNTMMGTSILSMPWAVQQAGFVCGVCLILLMGAITLYTAYRVMTSMGNLPAGVSTVEFSDVCRYYFGRWGEYISVIFSLIALLGAAVVYWVLMSNFLYHSVSFIYEKANHELNSTIYPIGNGTFYGDVYCPILDGKNVSESQEPALLTLDSHHAVEGWTKAIFQYVTTDGPHAKHDTFHKVWLQYRTVPFFLLLVLFPLINFKSPTFFTKFNSLGTISIVFILVFVAYKASTWGIHVDLNPSHSNIWDFVPMFKWSFPALTGLLSLAMFIHNCILSIVKNQKHPENNGRDLSIAYFLVAFTYLFIGVVFYISFPLPKHCIEDNLLNNFRSNDTLAFVARMFLFFQMVTVFPLLMYIFRIQLLNTIFGSIYPSIKHVIVMNWGVIIVCLLFAMFMPKIGTIIRFSGSMCGLCYIFTLPCLVYMLSRQRQGTLTKPVAAFHIVLIVLGVANFVAQFAMLN